MTDLKFRWRKKSSEQAVICMAYARFCCAGSSVEDAVRATLETERHCINSSNISDKQFRRICKLVEKVKVKHAAS